MQVTKQLGDLDPQKKLLEEQLKANPNQPALSIRLQTLIGTITRLTASKTDIEQKYARLQEQVRQLQQQHQVYARGPLWLKFFNLYGTRDILSG